MSKARSTVLKIGYGFAVLFAVLGLALLPLGPAIAATGVPRIINYQGRLMDANGVLLGGSGTEYCFKFSLHDNPTVGSGTKLWPATSPSTTTASVKNGIFNVGIGDTNVGGDTLDFNFQDTDTVYVQVEVATKVGATCAFGDGGEVFETLSPRQRIHSSGYAINAGTVGGFLAAQYASGNQIPVLASGHLVLGGTNPFINATTTNTLTLQGGGQVSGDIQFFSAANKITAAGNATFAGNVTAASSTITNATSTTFFATLGRFTSAIIETLTATVATIINLTATNFIATNATTTNATTTNFAVTSLASALLSTNAQGTLVATTSISANYIDTSGNWTGFFDGQEGSYYLANSFSTTSATYFANASSTIPKTYSDNVFTGGNVFRNTTTTNATTTNLTVSGLASTTGLIVSNLNAASCDVKANQFGVLSCGIDATGGGVDPFPGNATTSLLTFSGGLIAFASSTIQNLSGSNATITNATSTSFFSTLARFTTGIVDTLTAAVATITNLTATNAVVTNSTTTNATTTNLFASAITSLSGVFGNLSATTSATFASTTAQGRFITGNIISTSTATSSFNGPIRVGITDSSYLVSVVGSTTAPTSATGTAILAVSNTNPTLSSGSNILRLNHRTGFGTTCVTGTTCPRFIEYFVGVGENADTGGRGVGSLRLSTAGTGITQTSGAADFAEFMVLNSSASVGDIVSLNSNGEYQKAVAGQSLIGVISDNPAFVGNANLEGLPNAYVVGFAGVIETTVSDANGAITPGDFIAASTTAGVGVKLLGSGFTLGQALEAWNGPGTGQISVLVFPKYIDAAVALESYGGGGGGTSGYFTLATSTGVVSLASSTYSLALDGLTIANASTTNISSSYSSSTQGFFGSLSVGNLSGVLRASAGAVSTGLVNLATEVSGILGISRGGTGTSTAPAYGQLLVGNATGGYDLIATSSLGIQSATWGNITGTLSNQSDLQSALDARLSLTAWYATTTDGLAQGVTNRYYSTLLFASDLAGTTTDALDEGTNNLYYTNNRVNSFISSSSTIPKTYTNNTFTGGNVFGNTTTTNATTTNLAISGTASTSQLVVSSLNAASCDVKATPAGVLICGADSTGATLQDAFSNGATSTLLTFNAGIITFGSSTVQNLNSSNATITNATSTSFFASLARFTTGIVDSLTAAVATITNLNSTNIITTNSTSTNATTTNFAITNLPNTILTTNAQGTVVATTSISGNYIEKTGNWTGTFDGFEGSYYLANSFSTTSALAFSQAGLAFSTTSSDYWKSVNNFFSTSSSLYFASAGLSFSTTSAQYFLSQNQGAAFSTTSATHFVDASTTIAKTYTENVFTSGNTFLNTTTTNATTTNLAVSGIASTSQLIVSSLNATSCDVKATPAGVLICGTDNSGVTLQDAFSNGATTTMLTFSNGLMAFGSSTIANLSGTNATITNATTTSFFSTLARFTTAIADSLTAAVATITSLTSTNIITVNSTSTNATTTNLTITTLPNTVLTTDSTGRVVATTSISGNFIDTTGSWTGTFDGREGSDYLANSFSTTSADNWKNNRDFFSTSSANYFSSVGLSFSTTSNDYWKSINNFYSTSSALYFTAAGLSFSTTSADAWKAERNFFSTTSADAWKSTRDFFSTTSAQYLAAVGLSWSTTSANYFAASFIDASTTIPKLYSSNVWTSGNIFGNTTTTNATTTNLSVSGTASTSQLIVSNLNAVNCDVKASALGVLTCGTDSGGIDPFPGNATTSLLTFSNGILVSASSTLGNGTAAGGITIAGNATTTGKLIVQGNATSTFASGIDLASGCFSVNGQCISGSGGGSSGVLINIQAFTAPGTTTYTPSAGAVRAEVILTGGGGGGGGADAPTADTANETVGGGGGAGATSVYFVDLTATTSVQVTVGAGGAAGAISGGAGGNGGWSRFSTFASSTGGAGGGGSAINAACAAGSWGTAGSGGTAAGGNVNIPGGSGHIGDCLAEVVFGGLGGASYWGGGGRGGTDPAANGGNPGVAGAAYGSGGGGAANEDTDVGVVGGAGANGIIVIYEYGPYTGVMGIDDGGTGTTTAPTYGQILVGNSLGGYDLVSTSSLGIVGGGGGSVDPFPGNATNTTLTFNGGLFAAGSSTVESLKGTNATITNATTTSFFATAASSTHLFTSNLSIGTLTGVLRAVAGAVTTGLLNLATEVTGTLGVGNGGTGLGSGPSYGQLLVGNASGGYDLAATSSLGLITTHVAEGSNLYYTNARVQTYLDGIAKGYFFSTTSSVYLASAGLSWSTTSASHFIDASSTIPKTYSSNTFTGNNIFNGTLTLGTLNGPLHANNGVLSATTSIGAVYGGTGQTTYAVGDILYASAANTLSRLAAGSPGTVLKMSGGVPSWGTDNAGGGGGAGAWSTSTNDTFLYPADSSDVVVVGNNATTTTTSIFEVVGNSYFSSVVGIGTTSPGTLLSIGNVANFAPSLSTFYSALSLGNLTATSTLTVSGQTTFVNASSTAVGALDYLAVGRNGTTTIQGNSTGTSTIQGFINVTGTNSTSTFSGGLAASRLALTGTATSTAVRGIDIATGCFAINGNCIGGVTSVSAANSSVTVSPTEGNVQVSLNLANANTWTGLQVFSGNASTTAISANDYIAIGRTATTTIQGNTTGTSTIQGFVNVAGTNSTSTFSGNLATNRVAVTGSGTSTITGNIEVGKIAVTGTGTSTFAGGINLTGGGCVALNGTCIKSGTDGVQIYASTTAGTGTWTAPAGVKFAQVIVTGAGGGGGGAAGTAADADTQAAGGGGGAGATTIETFTDSELGSSQSFTVGAAGTGGTDVGGNGTAGGASYFGTLLGANGGALGAGAVTTVNALGIGGAGGAATTTGDAAFAGGDGQSGMSATEGANGGDGGPSYWGGGGKGGASTAAGSVAGAAGTATGSGGGGGGTTDDNATPWAAGGNGAVGGVFVFSYTASGADLAEWYPSEIDVLPGDIVAISDETLKYESFSLGEQRVAKMKKAAPGDKVVGVVATLPHTVMGGEILGDAEHASPVALAGRVPVKVSTEGGVIRAGDYLSISSVPGVAKRATKAGVTIGKALEDANCAEGEGEEVASSTEEVSEDMVAEDCKVMVLVNTTYTSGILLKSALAEAGIMLNEVPEEIDASRIALAYMLQEKKNFTASTELSEVSTDRIAAGLEIITPRVVADRLVANVIEPVEKDVSIVLEEDGSFVIGKASDELSVSFGSASTTFDTSVSIDALGNAVFAGQLKAMNIEIGSSEKPGGLTMYDAESGEPYCTRVVFGTLETTEGACATTPYIPLTLDSTPPPIPPLPPTEPEESPEGEQEEGEENTENTDVAEGGRGTNDNSVGKTEVPTEPEMTPEVASEPAPAEASAPAPEPQVSVEPTPEPQAQAPEPTPEVPTT